MCLEHRIVIGTEMSGYALPMNRGVEQAADVGPRDGAAMHAKADQINNTSLIERMWRNTHQGNILDFAYEGSTASPGWIAPVKNPYSLIKGGSSIKVLKDALQKTLPGQNLIPTFWNL